MKLLQAGLQQQQQQMVTSAAAVAPLLHVHVQRKRYQVVVLRVTPRRCSSIGRLSFTPACHSEVSKPTPGFPAEENAESIPTENAAGSGVSVKQGTWTRGGLVVTAVLLIFLLCAFLFVDFRVWRVIQRPSAAFLLTAPFLCSLVTSGLLGIYSVPLLARIKAQQIFRKEGPASHVSKAGTPTMGGLFFIPVGIGVARIATRFASNELVGVAAATVVFAIIGLLDDATSIFRKHNYGVPGWMKLLLEVLAGTWFFIWLDSTTLSSPYKAKWLLPLPSPFGLWYIGKWYLPLSAFCFAAMANGVNLTDGLDGLAGGTAALAFAGMAVAVLPIYPALGVFGASMAGACVGFLLHNRHRACVFMGDTGSLALGGGLAAMAACTGLFLPLLIASGVFVIETISVMAQVAYYRYTKRVHGSGRRLLRMAPFHHHLEHLGMKEAHIVCAAYLLSAVLVVLAAHVALISV